ncbi:hypothetical protein [Sorangium sp. So ce363]|uniref:hypothetical protein n=1 Tax=Sorangium sp. So ce363 TaxID=3133304 RepID=UPI003F5F69D5
MRLVLVVVVLGMDPDQERAVGLVPCLDRLDGRIRALRLGDAELLPVQLRPALQAACLGREPEALNRRLHVLAVERLDHRAHAHPLLGVDKADEVGARRQHLRAHQQRIATARTSSSVIGRMSS